MAQSDDLSPSLGGGAAHRATHYEPSLSLDRLLPGLRDALGSSDRGQRLETIEQIVAGGSEQVVPILIELLQDVDNTRSRQRIVAMLGQIGDVRAVGSLAALFGDADAGLRKVAAWALGQIGAAEAVEPLLALVERESDPRVTGAAILSLGKIGDLRALRMLLEYVDYGKPGGSDPGGEADCSSIRVDPLVNVAWTALKLIGQGSSLGQLIELLCGSDENLCQWATDRFIYHTGAPLPEHIPMLVKLMNSQSIMRVRQRAVHLLAAIESEQTRDIVLQLLADPDDDIRLAAFHAAREHRMHAAVDILLSRYAEEAGRHREALVETVGVMDDPRVVPFLLDLIEAEDVSWMSVHALGTRSDADVPHLLLERLHRAAGEARCRILFAFDYFNTPKVINVLLGIAANSLDEEERCAAVDSLRTDQYPEATQPLIAILQRRSSKKVRERVIWTLGRGFDAQVETALRAFVTDTDDDELRVEALNVLLSHEVSDATELLLGQIDRILDENALSGLIYQFSILEGEVAFPIVERLYRNAKAEPLRTAIIDEMTHYYHHDGAVPLVIDALKNDNSPRVRVCAVTTLYYLYDGVDQRIVDALIEALADVSRFGCAEYGNDDLVCDAVSTYLRRIDMPQAAAALAAWQEVRGIDAGNTD
jgi:HEAT repeat protein